MSDDVRQDPRNAETDPERTEPAAGRYHIETWGCQMNVHDSEKLAGALEREGYARAASAGDADVILLNTCSIRDKAEEKVFSELGRLRELKRANPDLLIVVGGCVAQQEGQAIFDRAPFVDLVVGPRATGSLTRTLARLREGDAGARRTVDVEYRDDSIRFPFDQIRRESPESGKAYVTIIEGCNHRCTYCIVPRTRGREISRPLEHVLAEVARLTERGILEIEFLGQTVNAYRDGAGRTLADLLRSIAGIDGLRRVRFTTSHPAQMTQALVEAMADARPVLCPYLHLPVQSGSSAVLERMRRGYDRRGYLSRIAELLARMPEMLFGTDIIVGFPGETEAEFKETMDLLDEVPFDTVYSFAYSERPGTRALELGDTVPLALKLERLGRLQARQKAIQEERNRAWVGRSVEVLVEGRSKRDPSRWTGRTPENRIVHFGGDTAPGRLERLRVARSTPYFLCADDVPTRA